MKTPFYRVSAFTDSVFGGNPAGVCVLKEWLPKDVMLGIARENAIAETAFFIPLGDNEFYIRWFTPELEMDLCGHATLATAHVLYQHLKYTSEKIIFQSQSGPLTVLKQDDLITLDFPSRKPKPSSLPFQIKNAMNIQPQEVFKSRDYVLVYENEEDILNIYPSQKIMDQISLGPGGVIVTAPGKNSDFVCRYFTPQASIFEDAVTGSAHCSLIPFWKERLGKSKMLSIQLSARRGCLYCEDKDDRVLISGKCVTYLKGELSL